MINNRRRRRLLTGGSAAAALALTGCAAVAAGRATATSAAGVRIELRAGRDEVALRPGKPTSVWRYTGRLLAGDPASLQVDVSSLLGPTLRLRRGQRVRIELLNELPEATTIHWHGLHVPKDMDGRPRHRYHAHPHGRTGPQVYRGLASLLLVSDDEEFALDLPRGAYGLPLVLQDRCFDGDNQLV